MERKPDPPPLRTDDVRTVAIGVALWAGALVVALVRDEPGMAWTCAAGLALGLIGIVYTKRRAAAIARDEASPSGRPAAGP